VAGSYPSEAAFMNVPVPALEDVENFATILEKLGYVKIGEAKK
jgi:hypothetical protein